MHGCSGLLPRHLQKSTMGGLAVDSISTEDAHALFSNAVEKSASLPRHHHLKGTQLIIPNPFATPYPQTSMLPTRTLPGGRTTREALPLGPNNLPLCRWCDLEIL